MLHNQILMTNKLKSWTAPVPVLQTGLLFMVLFIPVLTAVAQVTPIPSADSSLQALERLQRIPGKADSAACRIGGAQDSLLTTARKSRQMLLSIEQQTDSLHHALQTRLDSLLQLPAPDSLLTAPLQKLTAKTDSLRRLITSVKNKIQTPNELKNTEAAIRKASARINGQLSSLQNKGRALGHVDKLSIPLMSAANIPGTGWNIPSAGLKVPTVNASLPNTSLQLPQTVDVASPLGEVQNVVKDAKIPNIGDAGQAQTEIEDRIKETGELADLNNLVDPVERAKRYYDPDVAKEEALNKAKETAVNHFAGHEKELKAAIQKLSELKAKFPDAEQTLDLFSKRQKQLGGARLIDRLVPGLTLQGYSHRSYGLDLNPQVAFRISYRWAMGAGWVERVAYNFDLRTWDRSNRMYGARGFAYFKLRENFYLKGDAEIVNAALNSGVKNDETNRTWVWNYLGGIKKDFQLSKKMTGNVQVLYTIYRTNRQSNAYGNAFHLRIGFDIPLKKATRSPAGPQAGNHTSP
jgi:hypothetical protein